MIKGGGITRRQMEEWKHGRVDRGRIVEGEEWRLERGVRMEMGMIGKRGE